MATNSLADTQIVNTLTKVTNISGEVFTLSNINETYHTFNTGEQAIMMQMQDDVIDGTHDNSLESLNNIASADGQDKVIFVRVASSTNNVISGYNNNSSPCANQANSPDGTNDSSVCDNNGTAPLPVSLIYFIGFYKNESDEVELKWTTASEANNNYFTLERSPDGLTFNTIGSILGNGTTSIVNKYQYTSKNNEIKRDSYYYRLSQTDLDGTKKNLETIHVKRELKPTKIWVYPTSVQQTKNIHIDFEGLQEGIYTVAILNTNGDRIIQDQVNINYNFQSMEIETSDIPNGLYIIHIFSTADTFIQRIIVQ